MGAGVARRRGRCGREGVAGCNACELGEHGGEEACARAHAMWVFSIRVPVLRCFGGRRLVAFSSVVVAWLAASAVDCISVRLWWVRWRSRLKIWTTTAADAVLSLEVSSLSEPHHFAVLRILRVKT